MLQDVLYKEKHPLIHKPLPGLMTVTEIIFGINVSFCDLYFLSICVDLTLCWLCLCGECFYMKDLLYVTPTHRQAARAGNVVHAMLQYRRKLERGEHAPVMLAMTSLPLLSNPNDPITL